MSVPDPLISNSKEIMSGAVDFMAQDTVRSFERIRAKLKRHETTEFQPLGPFFAVESNLPD